MDKVPMEFKYEPCCGVHREPYNSWAFIGGHELRILTCPDCSNELRTPITFPEYKFCTLWNTIANKGEV